MSAQQNSTAKIVRPVLSADGTKIYVDAVGDPSNLALVFTHGFSTSCAVFDSIFSNPENSKDFFLVRYDSRGHSRSGKPRVSEGYSSQKFAEDFEAVCKAFDIKKPIFVGWSMGGKILADIATYLPSDTLLGAVSLGGAPFFTPKMQNIRTQAMNAIIGGLLSADNSVAYQQASVAATRLVFVQDPNPPVGFLQETVKALQEGSNFEDDNPAVSWETQCLFLGMSMHSTVKERLFTVSRQQDSTAAIKLFNGGLPLLVIHGTHDAFINGEKLIECIRPDVVNLEVKMIQGGSHAVFVEKPDEVMAAILAFAKKLNG